MYESLMPLLFFPDWTNGLPSDFLILHFFVGAIIFPFNMIHAKPEKLTVRILRKQLMDIRIQTIPLSLVTKKSIKFD